MRFLKDINYKNFIFFTATLISTLVILMLIIKPWNVDLRLPLFGYEGDNLFSHFIIKTITDNGWFDVNKFVGMPYEFNISDFPMNADFSYMAILKILSYFSSNIYLICNCFFIISFLMISATSFIALRAMGIEHFICLVIAILYSFLPFHFYRNTYHAFIANYYSIPLIIMMSLWLLENKVVALTYKNSQLSFGFNAKFYICLSLALIASICGIYYAFYSCVILSFVLLIKVMNGEENKSAVIFIITAIIVTSFFIQIPSLKYWIGNGANQLVVVRSAGDSELYGLRIVYLFVPIENHYIVYLADIGAKFLQLKAFESKTESLGIIGSIGFLFLLLWLLAKNYDKKNSFLQRTIDRFSLNQKDQNLISNLANLNLLSILFATVGGLVMFIAISFPFIRSHARFVVFIAFISLSLIAVLLNQIYIKTNSKSIFNILLIVILLFGIFDQVGIIDFNNRKISKVENDRNFVTKIENSIKKDSAIFMLPITYFPEGIDYDMLRPYLASKNLRWSAPAIRGRKSDLWQRKIVQYDFNQFIKELKKSGFEGVYIDRKQYIKSYDAKRLKTLETKLQSIAKMPKLISADNELIFFAI